MKQRRRCLGLIKASSTCLAFGPKGQIRFGELLDILQKGLKDGWTQETIDAQQEIADHEGNVDWVLWDPAYIVSDTRSLLILTDSSNYQLGLGLFTIKKADAATIKPEDVEDISICGILDLTPKKLTTAEQNYHASENELTGDKEAVLRYGKIITTATADYPEDGMSKVALATDSTVSQGKWKTFKMPHIANFDYLNAKAMRLYSWLDQIAFTRLWPMVLLHFPGELITLLDFVSRTALFFFEEAKRRKSVALNGEHVALSASAQILKQ